MKGIFTSEYELMSTYPENESILCLYNLRCLFRFERSEFRFIRYDFGCNDSNWPIFIVYYLYEMG